MSRPNLAIFQEAHPPRRYVNLQRLTNRRSRSIGFTAPSPSFRLFSLDPDVFRRPASQSILTSPGFDTTRGLTLALEDFLFLSFFGCRTARECCLVAAKPPPMEFFTPSTFPPEESTSRLGFAPECQLLRSAQLRRGVPSPLRSAFVVFRDLDGFLLLEPCGLFHPLTSVGFGAPFSPPSADPPPALAGWSFTASPV